MAVQGGEAGLAACDVVIEVDGERGLSAEETKRRVEQVAGPPLQLLVRRAALRSKGCKLGPPVAQLEGMAVRTLVQCLMLYPQVRPVPVATCNPGCSHMQPGLITCTQCLMHGPLPAGRGAAVRGVRGAAQPTRGGDGRA